MSKLTFKKFWCLRYILNSTVTVRAEEAVRLRTTIAHYIDMKSFSKERLSMVLHSRASTNVTKYNYCYRWRCHV